MKKRLVFIRHGRQSSKKFNLDVPLSPEGIEQAKLLANRLENSSFDILYTSTLIRAIETGNIINNKLGLDVIRRSELNEVDCGKVLGLTYDEIDDQFPESVKEKGLRTSDFRYPGGENGEDAYNRALPVIKEMLSSDYKNILIVSHGGLIRSLIAGLLGLPFKSKLAFAEEFENTSITEFAYNTETGLMTLERLNDHSHLDNYPNLLKANWKD